MNRAVVAGLIVAVTGVGLVHGKVEAITQVPAYDAFGFGAYGGGKLFALARRGFRHTDDPTGRIAWYGDRPVPALTDDSSQLLTAADTEAADDRNVAGGITPTGHLVFFYTKYHQEAGLVASPEAIVSVRTGLPWLPDAQRSESIVASCCAPDLVFSAYGPLVEVSQNRLMQTFYGRDASGGSSVYAMFSEDDGRSWSDRRLVDRSYTYAPSETAAATAGGSGSEVRLVAVSRTQRRVGSEIQHGLMQYTSWDAGRTWRSAGFVSAAWSTDAVIPWLAPLSGGRLALVWADRGRLTINVSTASTSGVMATPDAWPAPRVLYTSHLDVARPYNRSNFGYPSVASAGPLDTHKTVVFYDTALYGLIPSDVWSQVAGPVDRRNYPVDADLFALPLTASGDDAPVRLHPGILS